MKNLGDEWRPDRSKIIIRTHNGGLVLQALESPLKVLASELSLTLVGDCISNSIPVFISVPGKKGHCYCMLQLNDALAPAIKSRDFGMAQAAMVKAINYASQVSTSPIIPFGI